MNNNKKLTDQEIRIAENFAKNVRLICKKRGYVVWRLMKAAGSHGSLCNSLQLHKQRLSPEILANVSEIIAVPQEALIADEIDERYFIEMHEPRLHNRRPAAIQRDSDHLVSRKICRKCQYRAADTMAWACDYIDFTGKPRKVDNYKNCPSFVKGSRLKQTRIDTKIPGADNEKYIRRS